MTIARLTAASLIALASVGAAQELPIYDASQFGQVIVSTEQSALPVPQYEALVGNNSLELMSNFNPKSRIARLGRAVGKLDILTDMDGYAPCTAFLVADNKLLTAHHCVPGLPNHPKIKGTAIAAVQFHAGFIQDGIKSGVKTFEVNPLPLETNKNLDYSVLQVIGDANAQFGALELSGVLPRDADPLLLIGHPLGWAQRISREKCRTNVPAVRDGRVLHTCDTMPGNSGSPVFDDDRRHVVALHSAVSGSVNLAVPMAEILASSQVLSAAPHVTDPYRKLAALLEELDRLKAEAAAQAEAKRQQAYKSVRARALAIEDQYHNEKDEQERERLAKELAELLAELAQLHFAGKQEPPTDLDFDFDERGLVRATPDGALTPEGLRVFSGRPPLVPPLRSERDPIEQSPSRLHYIPSEVLRSIRPKSRPADAGINIDLKKLNLISVYGSAWSRRALVRLADGKYQNVKVGDQLDVGQVTYIGTQHLRYTQGNRTLKLTLPSK